MSILIGVNDVWHDTDDECPNGVSADKFYKVYSMLISEIKEALPDIKIIILEPFVLKAAATECKWDFFSTEVPLRAAAAKKIAEDFSLTFVPLQAGFDALEKTAPASYWLVDGVHPSAMGHQFIKQQWLNAFKTL